jgi:prevent-host-death family protein
MADGLTPYRGMAIVIAMALSEHLSLADVKNRLSEVVDRLQREHGRVVVTKHGQPAAVMLNVDDLESLEETLEILSNPRLRDAIREGEADVAAGRTERLTKDQALARVSTK